MIKLKSLLKEEKEYIIWGIPPKKREEEILFTKAKSMGEARKVMDILKTKYEVKGLRIQTLDISQDTDFSKEFGKGVNEITDDNIDDISNIIDTKYNSVIKIEHDEDWRGEFIRITFTDYKEAMDFYNTGNKLLSKIVKVQRVSDRGPKINGRLFIVSYKIY